MFKSPKSILHCFSWMILTRHRWTSNVLLNAGSLTKDQGHVIFPSSSPFFREIAVHARNEWLAIPSTKNRSKDRRHRKGIYNTSRMRRSWCSVFVILLSGVDSVRQSLQHTRSTIASRFFSHDCSCLHPNTTIYSS
jgi:hypothetical protein